MRSAVLDMSDVVSTTSTPSRIYTREQLVSRLAELGFNISDRSIRYWCEIGAISRPQKMYGRGNRCWYSERHVVDIVAMLASRTKLRQIAEDNNKSPISIFTMSTTSGATVHFNIFQRIKLSETEDRIKWALRYDNGVIILETPKAGPKEEEPKEEEEEQEPYL